MLKKFLVLIFLFVCGLYIWFFTPISSEYYMNKGVSELKVKNYSAAVTAFERSLGANPSNPKAEYFLVQALSEMEPTYTVQKKLYKISQKSYSPYSKRLAKSTILQIRRDLLKDLDNNYIYNAIQGKDVIRWDIRSFPLKVYIENSESVPDYYVDNLFKAMHQWDKKTGFIKFEKTNDKNSAQIRVIYKDINDSDCSNNSECAYAIAYTEPVISSKNVLKYFNLTFHRTNPKGENYSAVEVYNTSLHELGHTLGIMGHSDNPNDIMYATNERANDIYSMYRSDSQYLTLRDLKTIALLYSLAPDVSNVSNLSSEKFYYPQVILGADDEVLMQKIKELDSYIRKYPNMAAGYINIASVYAELGDLEKALAYINMAERLANTEDERYMTYYNRSVIFFNRQDFRSAKEAAQKAKDIRNNSDIQDLINEIDEMLK